MRFKKKTVGLQIELDTKISSLNIINDEETLFLSKRYIRSLMKVNLVKKAFKYHLQYSGTIGVPLSYYLKTNITKRTVLMIIEQIVDLYDKLQRCILSTEKVIFDINYTFINETTNELQFIYLPFKKMDKGYDCIEFIKSIAYRANNSKNSDGNDYLLKLIYLVNGMETINVKELDYFIYREDRSVYDMIKGRNKFMITGLKNKQDYYSDSLLENNQDDEGTVLLSSLESSEEETTLLTDETTLLVEDEEATTSLDGNYPHYPSLLRILNDEIIDINKPVFRLGKEKKYCDYFINDNSNISRAHADIITRNNRYFVIDQNSKNKTYINYEELPVKQEIEIHDGDKLTLANEDFIFRE